MEHNEEYYQEHEVNLNYDIPDLNLDLEKSKDFLRRYIDAKDSDTLTDTQKKLEPFIINLVQAIINTFGKVQNGEMYNYDSLEDAKTGVREKVCFLIDLLNTLDDEQLLKFFKGDEIKQTLEEQDYKKPKAYAQSLTKPMRMFDSDIDLKTLEKGLEISVGKNKHKPVLVSAQLVTSNEISDILPKNIDDFDRAVLDGVCTLHDNGNKCFTLTQLCYVLTKNDKPTANLKKAVEKSIQKLQTTLLKLDWTAHADMKHIIHTETFRKKDGTLITHTIQPVKTEEAILRIRKDTFLINGSQSVEGYILEKTPALWQYAKAVKQIAYTNIDMLKVDCNATPENIVLRNELIRHIEHTNKNKNWSNTISLQSIYDHCNVPANKTATSRARKHMKDMLDCWKRNGYIKNYKFNKEGNSYKSITIIKE